MDRTFTQVLGDLWTRIVCSKEFLIDEFLKNIAEYMWADLVVIAFRCVIQVPGVAGEQVQQMLERYVRNANTRPSFLNGMQEK